MKRSAVLLSSLALVGSTFVSGCSVFFGGGVNNDLREANNNFRYLDEVANERTMRMPAGTSPIYFSKQFEIPPQVKDSRAAIVGRYVDVRPPQKLIETEPNLIGYQDGDLAVVWFYPEEDGTEVTTNEMLETLLRFFKRSYINVDNLDAINSQIQTDWFEGTEFADPYSLDSIRNDMLRYRQRYLFRFGTNKDGVPGVVIQLTDNIIERPDGTELADGLNRFEPSRFSALMANRLMWSYSLDKQLAHQSVSNGDISITLDRDNNNLPCWLVSANFDDTYNALQQLMIRYDIQIKEYSSTGGEITVDYDELEPEFWQQQSVEPWGIDSGVYLFKLGIHGDKTTITLYDKNQQPVAVGITARMYSGFADSLKKQFLIEKSNKSVKK